MEEYIKLEEEKACRHAIVFNDKLTSEEAFSCEPMVSPLYNNKIDFRISFNEYEDEDYTPIVSCFDDLDFFKDVENEFPAIVYNDTLTSKSDFLTEPTLSPQHIDEFDLKDETSLSEYEVEQNILYFNDLFPFNIIYPDDLKSDKDNDDNEIDIMQSSGDLHKAYGYSTLMLISRILRRGRMLIEHRDAQGYSVFTSRAWRRLFEIKGPLVHELILEFFSTFRFGEAVLDLDMAGAL
ncbi:hypothetical protein Tco_0623953 [Tanacetum coccineum]|uniref:Uncharacterized protein n=1 Tax=Tanacetum coccineum TaxID=301880 RepID=A0ABQ4WCM4_9ASTR